MLITARIDRPLGSAHPRHPDLIYPVNYGEGAGEHCSPLRFLEGFADPHSSFRIHNS